MKKLIVNIFLLLGTFSLFTAQVMAGTITGSVVYEGKVPKFKPIKMDADPVCLSKHSNGVYPETLVLGEGNTMGNVFVHIKSGLSKKKYEAPKEPAVLDQKGCTYSPHVLGVMVGQPLKILNPDGTLHNVHALSKINPAFNLAMPKFRKEMTKVFEKEEFMFPIKCDVHPWMGGWVAVMSHPFFTVTEKDGKFEISGLEAGTYEVEAWHEKLGTQSVSVTVGADDTKEASFTFTRPSKK